MLTNFAAVLVFLVVAVLFLGISLSLSRLIHPRDPNKIKLSSYECGEIPVGDSWIRFNLRFYVIALVFLVFEVEIVFLFPWAVVMKQLGLLALVEVLVFVTILFVGLVYVWKKGDLEWVKTI